MLQRADALYAQGKKTEAAVIYKKIRKEHNLTTTYLLNRSKIKKRGKERDEPGG